MWTRGNYLATVAAIAASEHGALSCDALEGIPQTGGEEAISSMVLLSPLELRLELRILAAEDGQLRVRRGCSTREHGLTTGGEAVD